MDSGGVNASKPKDAGDIVKAGAELRATGRRMDLNEGDVPRGLVDLRTECAVIAAVFADRLEPMRLPPASSFTGGNAVVVSAIRHMYDAGHEPTADAVGKLLASNLTATQALRDVEVTAPDKAPIAGAHRVQKLAEARGVNDVVTRIGSLVGKLRTEEALALMAELLDSHRHDTPFLVENAAESAMRVRRMLEEGAPSDLIRSGIYALDSRIGGLGAGSMTIVAASSSVGKTGMALGLLDNVARGGVSCAIVSCEDGPDILATRITAREAGLSAMRIRRRERVEGDLERIDRAIARLRDRPLFAAYAVGATDVEVVAHMTRLVRDYGVQLLCIDYVGAVRVDAARDPRDAVTRAARLIKATAARLGVPVILLSQITEAQGEVGHRPTKNDLRDSRDLTHMAENVVLLWRTEETDDAPVFGTIAKSKTGGGGTDFVLHREQGVLVESRQGRGVDE